MLIDKRRARIDQLRAACRPGRRTKGCAVAAPHPHRGYRVDRPQWLA